MSTDENLLFGVLALQADLIDAPRFAEACSAWAARKEPALAELLVQRGWLTPADRADVEKLVRRKLLKHQGDARASLAEVTTDRIRHSLAGVADGDVQRSLAEPPGPPLSEPATTAFEAEARGRYTLARLHAQGGIGQVWLARDEQLGREVALKELRPERKDHAQARARFLEEARVTGQLEHPGIVPVHELARGADGGAFYTMRMVRGRTLSEAIKEYHHKRQKGETGRLQLRKLLSAFVSVCNAVAYAHSRGVIHRDLKPANVVLGDYGEVVVLDWGLAKFIGQQEETTTMQPVSVQAGSRDETMQGQVLGTPGYVAPEQAEGRLDLVGPHSDVYGLGAILYQILTGRPPFEGGETPTLLQRVVREEPARPRQSVATTSRALEAVCLKALAKKPADRYASADELAKEVERWLADEPVVAWREPLRVRAARWVRRRPALVSGVVVGLLVFVLLGGAAGAWWAGERQRQRAATESALQRVETLVDQGKLQEARGILEQTETRVGSFGSSDLRARLSEARDYLELVERLEAIRLGRVENTRKIDKSVTDGKFAEAFAKVGLGAEGDDVQVVARRINASKARDALLAGLDAWAIDAQPSRSAWILAVARAVDPDPVRDRLRDPKLRANKEEMVRAVAAVDGSKLSPELVAALGIFLQDREEGEKLLWQAQQARPGDFWLNVGLCVVLSARGKHRQAEAYSLASIALRPDAVAAQFLYAAVLMSQERFEEAEKVYLKVIARDPKRAAAHAALAGALAGQEKLQETVKACQTAIDLNPNLAPAHAILGAALADLGKLAEAEKACRRAIALDGELAIAHSALGTVLTHQGKPKEAEKAWRRAVALAPNDAQSHAGLGQALVGQERFAEGEKSVRKAIDLAPGDASSHGGLGAALLGQGKFADAEKAAREAIELDDDLALGHVVLGTVLSLLGRFEEAERHCRRAVELDPDNAATYQPFATALEQQGKWAEAEKAYRNAIKAGAVDPDLAVNVARLRRLAAMHPKLPAYLRGHLKPAGKEERRALVVLCRAERLHASAARFFAALQANEDPDDPEVELQYDAACSAALAAAGVGGDALTLDDEDRARLRRHALRWLKAGLGLFNLALALEKDLDRVPVRLELLRWQSTGDLAGVRDPKALGALPEEERTEWQKLWADVAALVKKTAPK